MFFTENNKFYGYCGNCNTNNDYYYKCPYCNKEKSVYQIGNAQEKEIQEWNKVKMTLVEVFVND